MGKLIGTYDFNEVIVTAAGMTGTGFADGESVTIDPDETLYETEDGIDGTKVRSRQNYEGGIITLTLHPQSEFYQHLVEQIQIDMETGNNLINISVIDVGDSGEKTLGRDCYAEELPERTYGRDVTERELVFQASELVYK